MLKIEYHKSFKRDYKRVKKQGYSIAKLETVIALLADEQQLPESYRDHALRATTTDSGSATFSRTGCSFTVSKKTDWF